MITGEYAVLDGADSLAIPTRFGQRMKVKKYNGSDLIWKSYDKDGEEWFSTTISLYDFSAVKTSDKQKSDVLQKILKNAVRLNPEFLDKWNGFKVETHLEFPLNWGLGSSSTIIYLIASWAEVNPLELYFKSFDGSGYDVACAGAKSPIVYYCDDDEIGYTPVSWNPSFKDNLYFLHLGKKQDSQSELRTYLKSKRPAKKLAKSITEITDAICATNSFQTFCDLVKKHESIMSEILKRPSLKDDVYADFDGTMKSLGAWGGDFALVASQQDESVIRSYFDSKGLTTILSFEEMILNAEVPV